MRSINCCTGSKLWSEGWKVEDRTQEIFSQYELKISHTYRVRGALLLDTDKGLKLLCATGSSESRLCFEDELKQRMFQNGYRNTDQFIRNKDGKISSANMIGENYLIKDWYEGEECSVYKEERILAAVANLAELHRAMEGIQVLDEQKPYHLQTGLPELFERRNREMKRVMTYIRERKQKSPFEVQYLKMWNEFYEDADRANKRLEKFPYWQEVERATACGTACHGSYNYHNILLLSPGIVHSAKFHAAETGESRIATTNFEKAAIGLQVIDLYQFMRKVMEKNEWNCVLAEKMLKEYGRIRRLSEEEQELLSILLEYPEKFWKLTNFYYNNKKSWIPQKNMQKLESLQRQQKEKTVFLQRLNTMI